MNDKRFYEEFWSGYSTELATQLATHRDSRRPLHRMLEKYLPANGGSRFLEVGCGTALDACLLARTRPAAQPYAMDLSLQAVTLARRNAAELRANLQSVTAELTALPFPSGFFHLVFSQGVLEHFEDPSAAIAEQRRVLQPGGALVIDVPQKYNLYTVRKHRAMLENRWDWGWETEYSVGELRALGESHGLKYCEAVGHQHGRIVDRLMVHPHRMLRSKLARLAGRPNGYRPGAIASLWESGWDWIDATLGPYVAINVAVAFRKALDGRTAN